MAHPLTHEELILVARLMTNHIVGNMPPELERVCTKLLDYAERTTGTYATAPLKVRSADYWGGNRVVIAVDSLEVGA